MCWFDAGLNGRSIVGLHPIDEVRGDDLGMLGELPRGYWLGWLSYEAGVDALLGRSPRSRAISGVCLRRFDGLAAFDSDGVEAWGDAAATERIEQTLRTTPPWESAEPWPLGPLRAPIDPQTYRARVRDALEEIAAGNTYQVNLSQPLHAGWTDQALHRPLPARIANLYGELRFSAPASHGGVIVDGSRALISNSPETLLHWKDGRVRSSPIKGTRPRGRTSQEDAAQILSLEDSAKDAAEHVMIVDLVRNDLGRFAIPGSVRASGRPRIVTLPTVHHLVTDVWADVEREVALNDLLVSLFPGGSITGAPKRASVEIIERIETSPRGIYCGGFVLITPDEVLINIAIRSGIADADGLQVHGGGGIVIDSDPEDERLETLAKVRAFAGPNGQPHG